MIPPGLSASLNIASNTPPALGPYIIENPTMPNPSFGDQLARLYDADISLAAALGAGAATVLYSAIDIMPLTLLFYGFLILFIGSNSEILVEEHFRTINKHVSPEHVPSGTYFVLLSTACISAGLLCYKYLSNT